MKITLILDYIFSFLVLDRYSLLIICMGQTESTPEVTEAKPTGGMFG